jgi:lysophospholipase L1-like esterase
MIRRTILILLAIGLAIALYALNMPQPKQKTRIVFFGDSITEAGANQNGYISQIGLKAKEKGLAEKMELIGAGVSGDRIYDLYLRHETDVIARSPEIVVIFIGVNDIWQKKLLGTGTDYGEFVKFYIALVDKLQSSNIKVVVCTPAVIYEKTDSSNGQDDDLNLYSDWIRDFAKKRSLPLVDLRKSFFEHNLEANKENKESGILTTDGVHLNDKGNELVATEMWKVLEGMAK